MNGKSFGAQFFCVLELDQTLHFTERFSSKLRLEENR